ncbi:MAG: hypothetical protein K8R12_05405 [Desulfobacterales bacterium]|nr:hypothetical protein [Desulfobacterales bacterium]MCD4804371.1 hypothetical protein [Desulfobacterales bacterium]
MSLHNQLQKLLVKGRLSEVADDNIISLKGGEDENRQFKHQFIILASKIASRFDKQPVRPDPIQKQTINFKRIRITLILGETIPFKRILT